MVTGNVTKREQDTPETIDVKCCSNKFVLVVVLDYFDSSLEMYHK